MRQRLTVAFSLAVLGFFATTGVSSAALLEDRNDVMIATGLVSAALMVVLFVFYGIRRALGLDRMPPPIESDPHDAHH